MKTHESGVPQMAPQDDDNSDDDSSDIESSTTETAPKKAAKKEKKKVKGKKEKKAKGKPTSAKAVARSLKSVPKSRGRIARTDLTPENATANEMKILKLLYSPKGERKPFTIKEIQKGAFTGSNTSKTRNTLRPLVKFGWLEQVEGINPATKKPYRGTYRLTEKGRKRGLKA
jgi:CRISPR/Cas system-associated protein Cas5 (RAMP superfamily)